MPEILLNSVVDLHRSVILLKKRNSVHLFSNEFCKMFQNNVFTELCQETTSKNIWICTSNTGSKLTASTLQSLSDQCSPHIETSK